MPKNELVKSLEPPAIKVRNAVLSCQNKKHERYREIADIIGVCWVEIGGITNLCFRCKFAGESKEVYIAVQNTEGKESDFVIMDSGQPRTPEYTPFPHVEGRTGKDAHPGPLLAPAANMTPPPIPTGKLSERRRKPYMDDDKTIKGDTRYHIIDLDQSHRHLLYMGVNQLQVNGISAKNMLAKAQELELMLKPKL